MTRLGAQAAMLVALETTVVTLLVERPRNLLLLTALAAAFWVAGPGRSRWRLMLAVLAVGSWSVVVSQGFFYAAEPRTALLRLLPAEVFPFGTPPGLYLYREGLLHGAVQSLRFSVVILLGAGLLGRYATDELTAGLRGLRVPEPVCFLFSMALRFLPLLMEEARATWHAQHFRGFRLRRVFARANGPLAAIRALAFPLLAAQVRKSDEVSAALLSRGFSPGDGGWQRPPSLSGRERALCLTGGALVIGLALATTLTRLHLVGVWSRDWLNWLYNLAELHV